MEMIHKLTLIIIRQTNKSSMLKLRIWPVRPVSKKEATKGMKVILVICDWLNRMLNYLGTDISSGKTAEQQTPKAIEPNIAKKKIHLQQLYYKTGTTAYSNSCDQSSQINAIFNWRSWYDKSKDGTSQPKQSTANSCVFRCHYFFGYGVGRNPAWCGHLEPHDQKGTASNQ